MTDYTQSVYVNSSTDGMIVIPSTLSGFYNTFTEAAVTEGEHKAYCICGNLPVSQEERICPKCGGKMHVNNTFKGISIWHIPFGGAYSCLKFDKRQFRCSKCHVTRMQKVSFQAEGHHLTQELLNYTCDLLERRTYTL